MNPPKASNDGGIEWNRGNPLRRCVAISHRTGKRCGNWAIRGGSVCRYHGGSTTHIKRKAHERLEQAADRMAKELLGIAIGATSEAVKLAAVKDALDRAGLGVKQALELSAKPLAPWEEVLRDISFASITRAEHRALGALRDGDLAGAARELEVVDAEVVPPQEPRDYGARTAVDGADRPDAADVPANKSATATAPVASPPRLLTQEEAADVMRESRVGMGPVRRKGRIRRAL